MDKIDKYINKYKALNTALKKAQLSDHEMVTITTLSTLDAIQKTNDPDKAHIDLVTMLKVTAPET